MPHVAQQVEMVYGLLSMFSSSDRDDMSRTLLAMSSSPDSCVAMRQSGCLPLLIQVLFAVVCVCFGIISYRCVGTLLIIS